MNAVSAQAQESGDQKVLRDLGRLDRLFVLTLRNWLDGTDGQVKVWNGLATQLGAERARRILRAFEAFLDAIAVGQKRCISRHATCCPCLGADEALLADLVRDAAEGDAGSAATRAAGIVIDTHLLEVLRNAETLGLLLREIDGCDPATPGGVLKTQMPRASRLH
ncbi:MAG: hypothetical protein AAF415_08355 [Pseudomonadota bacterium]